MSKTKALLDGQAEITKKKNNFEQDKFHSYTNMHYTSIPESIHKLPKSYDKAKKLKDSDGDEYIMIDRVYGSIFKGGERLLQADGTYYKGKLYNKRRLCVSKDPTTGEKRNFYSPCRVTADGRWFDNGGLPIEAPKNLEPDKKKTAEEIEEELQAKIEKEKNILANLK